jgi:hypothetical protein
MHVFGHHDITANHKEIAAPNPLQRVFKEILGRVRGQVRTAAKATEGEASEIPLLADNGCARLSCIATILQM